MNTHDEATATSGESSGAETTHEVAGKTHEAAEQFKSKAAGRMRELRERADSSKQQAAQRIRRLGSALSDTGDKLSDEDEVFAQYAKKAAQRVDDFASYLSSGDLQTMIQDAERFARRKPGLFLGSALALGFVAGRLLKDAGHGLRGELQQREHSELAPRGEPFESEVQSEEKVELRESPTPITDKPVTVEYGAGEAGPR